MKQFDVLATRGPAADIAPYLVVLQADTLSTLASVLVAPMQESGAVAALKKLHVPVEFRGRAYTVLPEHLVSLPRSLLGASVGSLASARAELMNALDFLFAGY